MRLTSWNFLHGQVLNPASDGTPADALAASLNEIASDVIALQEIDCGLARTADINQVAEVARLVGARSWGFAPAISGTPGVKWRKLRGDEKQIFTDAQSEEPKNYYGIAIASSIPVKHWLRLELGKSLIGMPLAIAGANGKMRPIYVKDEPRVAMAAVLENGWTVINTHLSFVPLVNIYQLFKLSRWAKRIEREHQTKVALVGDFNLPWGIPSRITQWKRATVALSYPSWKPAISFDYILMKNSELASAREIAIPELSVSDHRPVSVDIS